jgi:glutamyl-Q tRNA(Asp) synthetase
LHAGSLVAALASWLDAKAHGGQWLVRIEDLDRPRCVPGTDRIILQQLSDCGLYPDATPVWQSQRTEIYQSALQQLLASHLAYPCTCSRKDIDAALAVLGQGRSRNVEQVYPGTCRNRCVDHPHATVPIRPAWRLRTDSVVVPAKICWTDRRLGAQQQDVASQVGDFIVQRADGCFSYQLAVVVDDAAQGVTDVVRGEDLVDNTARQILLQQCLGQATPRYLHTPLVLGANLEKLSKQNDAQALDTRQPLAELNRAALLLGLPPQHGSVAQALAVWVQFWALAAPRG